MFKNMLESPTGDFRGNDALFEVMLSSGIESISIKREIYQGYMRYRYKPETKTIKLTEYFEVKLY